MSLCLAILNYKKSIETEPLLKSIVDENYICTVYVLDNSSTDKSYSDLKNICVNFHPQEVVERNYRIGELQLEAISYNINNVKILVIKSLVNFGFCQGNNVIAKIATLDSNDDILFINNDTEYLGNFISQYHKIFGMLDENSCLSPLIIDNDNNIWYSGAILTSFGYRYNTKYNLNPVGISQMHSGCSFMINTSKYLSLNGLNEDYFISFDEPEFAHRFLKSGGKIYTSNLITLKHRVSVALGAKGSFLHDYYYFRNKILFYRNVRMAHKLLLIIAKIITFEIVRRVMMGASLQGLLAAVKDGTFGVTGEVKLPN